MPKNSIMFCGASDTKTYIETYNNISEDFNFTKPLNFINGEFDSDNYGGREGFIKNSIATIDHAVIIIFVIHKQYGKITWEKEFEHVIETGKNFLIFCHEYTYNIYRNPNSAEITDKQMIQQLNYLEGGNHLGQITINEFNEASLQTLMKEKISMLIFQSLICKEQENKRKSFVNAHLRSIGYKHYKEQDLTSRNERICRDILFDPFENKEIRKRALEFFTHRKTLTADELIQICTDPEQGLSRKAIMRLAELTDFANIILDDLYIEIISSLSSESDVGIVRRIVNALGELDIVLAIRHFPKLFPCDDSGVPRRIVRLIERKWGQLELITSELPELIELTDNLLALCENKQKENDEWKVVLTELRRKIRQKKQGE